MLEGLWSFSGPNVSFCRWNLEKLRGFPQIRQPVKSRNLTGISHSRCPKLNSLWLSPESCSLSWLMVTPFFQLLRPNTLQSSHHPFFYTLPPYLIYQQILFALPSKYKQNLPISHIWPSSHTQITASLLSVLLVSTLAPSSLFSSRS